jgi:hypothetical protein
MAKNIINITPDMAKTLQKVRKKTKTKLNNEEAIEQALRMLDKLI